MEGGWYVVKYDREGAFVDESLHGLTLGSAEALLRLVETQNDGFTYILRWGE